MEKNALIQPSQMAPLRRHKTQIQPLNLKSEKKYPYQQVPDPDCLSLSRKSSIIEDPMVASAKEREQLNNSKHPITRICLTGGPCAGKTTALATLSLHLK